mmetsp:Transcript_35915/g.57702  ORF Transcript_35915/g.57702 Transcript_35915/m.57702 type:complete len:149 (+) Transcript_35915:388-834(+)
MRALWRIACAQSDSTAAWVMIANFVTRGSSAMKLIYKSPSCALEASSAQRMKHFRCWFHAQPLNSVLQEAQNADSAHKVLSVQLLQCGFLAILEITALVGPQVVRFVQQAFIVKRLVEGWNAISEIFVPKAISAPLRALLALTAHHQL